MPLEFSHSKATWNYFGFMDFRRLLANQVGIDLGTMRGFNGDGEWPSPLNEPIIDLLNHSDCDGNLSPEQCEAIAPRLRELASNLADPYHRAMGLMLAEGMEAAAQENAFLEFY